MTSEPTPDLDRPPPEAPGRHPLEPGLRRAFERVYAAMEAGDWIGLRATVGSLEAQVREHLGPRREAENGSGPRPRPVSGDLASLDARIARENQALRDVLEALTEAGIDAAELRGVLATEGPAPAPPLPSTSAPPAAVMWDLDEQVALLEANVAAVHVIDELERVKDDLSAQNAALTHRTTELEGRARSLHEQAFVDELTGLPNLRYLREQLEKEVARARRYGRDLSVLFVDVDHFKTINDTHGHPVGDVVLRQLAGVLNAEVRSADTVLHDSTTRVAARYGGEEFVLVLPETGPDGAHVVADRLCRVIRAQDFPGGETQPLGRVTVSIGVTSLTGGDADYLRLLQRADAALYEAKNGGRNRVVVA